jgi:hypothetical protein
VLGAGEIAWYLPVSIRMEESGKWNLVVSKYFIQLASFKQPLSSRQVPRYVIPQITALLEPCEFAGVGVYCNGFGVE